MSQLAGHTSRSPQEPLIRPRRTIEQHVFDSLNCLLNCASVDGIFVTSCEASAARSTAARTALPPPRRGATVTATLHATGGPEDRAPAPPAARARPQAARAPSGRLPGLLGVKTQKSQVYSSRPQTVSKISVNAKHAQTETWFAMPFNDISTVHVFERLPMKGPS